MMLVRLSMMLLVAAAAARADTALTIDTTGSLGFSSLTRGWSFSTANDITVTALGWWDEGSNGLSVSHQVGIWNTSGTLLMSTTVNSGTMNPLVSGFRFNSSLTGSALLMAGTYVIGGKSATDPIRFALVSANITLAPGITFGQNRSGQTSFSFPGNTQVNFEKGAFGPTFQFTAAVPEPSGLGLIGAGLALLALRRNKARR